jgi:hypothetical protein
MARCGRLSAGVRNPGQPPGRQRRKRPGCPPQVPPLSDPSGEVAGHGEHRPHRTSAQPELSSPRCLAAGADGHCAARVRTLTGRCGTVADTRCPQRGLRTGRCPPAEPPADMTVETAAEGLQRFRPGGGYRTGYRHLTAAGHTVPDTPVRQQGDVATHRTGRRKQRTVNPLTAPTRYNFLCSPSRRPAKAACGGRLRPAGPNRTRDAARSQLDA